MALLVNAFDFREVDNNSNEETQVEENPTKCSIKKVFRTRKSRLFVAKYREPFRLYELQVLESSRCPMKDDGQMAISDSEHHHTESTSATCEGDMPNWFNIMKNNNKSQNNFICFFSNEKFWSVKGIAGHVFLGRVLNVRNRVSKIVKGTWHRAYRKL